eukprot:gnl/Dysnectes_brevis/2860_a3495_1057.p1 GENE.gnl/Dysnectes_brevis/2860_a3495_1057~~gnl/Dysnectes_brevis/2860_a3495_1057.p1  ORF type:complete len:467 (+),score=111.99 gnl/Dysnectes_brevis/2860_a3495_1057:94-1494(+)
MLSNFTTCFHRIYTLPMSATSSRDQSRRRRPTISITYTEKLFIFRKQHSIIDSEASNVPDFQIDLGVDRGSNHEEREFHLRGVVEGQAKVSNIPIPQIHVVPQFGLNCWQLSSSYAIHPHSIQSLPSSHTTQYDLEQEDFTFIDNLPTTDKHVLTEDVVEWIMDRLEFCFPSQSLLPDHTHIDVVYNTVTMLAKNAFDVPGPSYSGNIGRLTKTLFWKVYDHWVRRRLATRAALIPWLRAPPPPKSTDIKRPFRFDEATHFPKRQNREKYSKLLASLRAAHQISLRVLEREALRSVYYPKLHNNLNAKLPIHSRLPQLEDLAASRGMLVPVARPSFAPAMGQADMARVIGRARAMAEQQDILLSVLPSPKPISARKRSREPDISGPPLKRKRDSSYSAVVAELNTTIDNTDFSISDDEDEGGDSLTGIPTLLARGVRQARLDSMPRLELLGRGQRWVMDIPLAVPQ